MDTPAAQGRRPPVIRADLMRWRSGAEALRCREVPLAGDPDHALAMSHPVISEIRRQVAPEARAALGDRDRVAAIRLAAADIDIDRALDQELGVLA